ncbi:MAG TPA: molybdopterin molybdotransferase MoeA [Stackebrandtia sp.]|jgi:molybdopterin molybdotransferase|uniref:molybdopterin molybdotransferase MoeA n=1 Tax=Stackebrandtia sp. TaxID=2023065 RepID=UPI002D6F04E4|nr:molybdopterin molybdotransferase MoeA [Stackebrandtia sp.]HZE41169.1 molybdopterin molybdotransferase MoeA [Stackebrandtia sp.]
MTTLDWDSARIAVHRAGTESALVPLRHRPSETDGSTLAAPLTALTPLPAFPTSSVDGYAVRGAGPWVLSGRVLAGQTAGPIAEGTAVEVATGAMVPEGLEAIIRLENATVSGDKVTGEPRDHPEWRNVGEETAQGEQLLPAGTPVTPGVIGLAAAAGHDTIAVRPKPRASVLVFGDELMTEGKPGNGRVRDALGPLMPALLRRSGAAPVPGFCPRGPIDDTLDAHVAALRAALDDSDIVCTTGGTMHGPVDHLHPALAALDASYVVNTVAVRPGFPMLVAKLPGDRYVAGLPGNPQSAVVALASLVIPLIAGLSGRALPHLPQVRLAADIDGRGGDTRLALVRLDEAGVAHPVGHTGSSMLRGLATAAGFAVIEPGTTGKAGGSVRLLPLPGSTP